MKNIKLILVLFTCAGTLNSQLLVNSADGKVSIGHVNNPLDELDIQGDLRLRADSPVDRAAYRLYDHLGEKVLDIILDNTTATSPLHFRTQDSRDLWIIGQKVVLAHDEDGPASFILDNGRVEMETGKEFQWRTSGILEGSITHSGTHMTIRNIDGSGSMTMRSNNNISMVTRDPLSFESTLIATDDGRIGINEDDPIHELHLSGDLGMTGSIFGVSDKRIKRNIAGLRNALQVVSLLRPVSYDYAYDEFEHLNLPKGRQFGLLAQEVEKVLPDIVSVNSRIGKEVDSDLLLGVNHGQIIPFLIKAIQELQETTEIQSAQIEQLMSERTVKSNH